MNRRLLSSALVLIASAVSIGTWLDARATTHAAPRPGPSGEFVLAADFHVHAFPGDGALPGWDLRRDARRLGLDALVVSNHNQTLAAAIGGALSSGNTWPLLLPAQELTTPQFHIVAVGVRKTVDWRLPERELLDAIHRQGGVAIAAHPGPDSWTSRDDAILAALDGAEVAHPMADFMDDGRAHLDSFFARARTQNPTLAPIGSSDFHIAGAPGYCRTYVLARAVTADAILDAIREGHTVAEDRHGKRYGDPARIAIVEAHLASEPRLPERPLAERLVALVALAGLMLLVWVSTGGIPAPDNG